MLKNLSRYIILSLLVVILVEAYYLYDFHARNQCNNEMSEIVHEGNEVIEEVSVSEPQIMHIDLKGAVKNPGVYEMQDGAIINDVINLAGGFEKNAYTNNINLSKKISNEMVVYVYTKYEFSKLNDNQKITHDNTEISYDISTYVDNGTSIIESNNHSTAPSNEEIDNEVMKININTATKDQLLKLDGIGESKAISIIDYRTQNGQFACIEEIMNVNGIGQSVYAKIKDFITV